MTQKGKGRWKPGPLPPGADSDWNKTMARLECELFEEYYIRPSGGSINPEMAFANIKRFIKEDSHRSVSSFFYREGDRHSINLLMRQ